MTQTNYNFAPSSRM